MTAKCVGKRIQSILARDSSHLQTLNKILGRVLEHLAGPIPKVLVSATQGVFSARFAEVYTSPSFATDLYFNGVFGARERPVA